MDKVRIIEHIIKCWNEYGIKYAVGSGIEDYPLAIGRDIDIFINKQELEIAFSLAIEELMKLQFTVVSPIKCPWKIRQIFALADDCQIQIDLFYDGFLWGPVRIIDRIEPIYRIGPFKVDPWVSWVKRVLIKVLIGKVPDGVWLYPYEEEIVKMRCSYFFGKRLCRELLEILKSQDIKRIKILAPYLRIAIIFRWFLYHPLKAIWESFRWFWKKLRPYFYQNLSPIVAFVGPDGVGKTSLIQKIKFRNSFFLPPVIRHWRPGILPRLSTLIGRQEPPSDQTIPPQRKPGKGYWLRLLYYTLDFWLGRFRDNCDSRTLKPILYDRYFIDNYVDPVRYGFSSNCGIKLLYRLLPKPDLVILLYDKPECIYKRKPELPIEEIERQLNQWLKLAAEGYVDVILPVDRPPEELAKDVEFLIIKTFFKKHEARNNVSVDHELMWLKKVLYAGSDEDTNKPKSSFLHLALPDGRGYLLPLNSRKASVAGLSIYSPQKLKARVLKGLLKVGLQLGMAQHLLPKVNIDLRELEEHLTNVFGERNFSLAISLGTPGPHRKPVIQVMNQEGKVLGYVKVGWNEETQRLVQNEVRMLQYLKGRKLPFLVPQILYAGEWQGHFICVQSPPPQHISPASQEWSLLYEEALKAIASLSLKHQCLMESAFWKRLSNRIARMEDGYFRHAVERFMERVLSRWGDKEVAFHPAHGDFAPWNAFLVSDNLYLYDWEYASDCAPAGYDLFHFVVQQGWLVKGKKPGEILDEVKENLYQAQSYRQFIGMHESLWTATFELYLLERMVFEFEIQKKNLKDYHLFLLKLFELFTSYALKWE